MGFVLTLLLAIVFGVLGLLRPRIAFQLILALMILFAERGFGFSTLTGSWVFSSDFVGFHGLRLVEVITAAAYIPFALSGKSRSGVIESFRAERLILPILVVWIVCLVTMEYIISGKVEVGSWRLLVTGIMQFHMLIVLHQTNDERLKLIRLFLILLSIECVIGIGKFALGMNAPTPRGGLAFFWDTRQADAFGVGALILTAYILNFKAIDEKERIIPYFWAVVMWALLLITVGGTISRTIWLSTLTGMFILMIVSKRASALHYFVVILLASSVLGAILLAPGLEKFRDHIGRYVESMNLFDANQRAGNIDNDVHISNVLSYKNMLIENPDLIAVGFHGPSSTKYADLIASYGDGYHLGMAHNGLIRSLLFFGIVGLIVYLSLYIVIIRRTLTTYWRMPENSFLCHAGLACGIALFLSISATLIFTPPFYTTSKGLMFTFFELFILGASAHLVLRTRSPGKSARVGVSPQQHVRA